MLTEGRGTTVKHYCLHRVALMISTTVTSVKPLSMNDEAYLALRQRQFGIRVLQLTRETTAPIFTLTIIIFVVRIQGLSDFFHTHSCHHTTTTPRSSNTQWSTKETCHHVPCSKGCSRKFLFAGTLLREGRGGEEKALLLSFSSPSQSSLPSPPFPIAPLDSTPSLP